MKKLIAIFFLSLICLATFPGTFGLSPTSYELTAEADKGEIKNKEVGKDVKEFLVHTSKKLNTALVSTAQYSCCNDSILPQPLLELVTPPPNQAV